NLTIDLIYGSPTTSNEIWQQNIQQALDLGVQHLSCYCLTVEPQTALEHFVKKGKVQAVDDDKANEQFEILMTELEANGFVHYEISNFAKAGFFAQHNSNYWLGVPYLGIGPSAHSFNGKSRQWNIAHNTKYLKALAKDEVPYEREVLDTEQRYNEYVLTRLRTIWGCERSTILAFGEPYWRHFQREISVFLKNGTVVKDGEVYRLSRSGKMMADGIAMELFWG
ncbi:MAG: coproporphyrinogen III oxidase, partial [Bacteroidota bacterium]